MFWGLIMEPQKKYSQVVKKPFHVSMASLDLTSCDDDFVQVMCATENHKYLICTLQKEKTTQCPLDLNFKVGDEIAFITNGNSHVHLSGYLIQDEWDGLDDLEEEEEDEAVPVENVSVSNIISGKRPKVPSKGEKLPPAKKLKTMELLDAVNSQDESDDDSDLNISDMLAESSDDDVDEDVEEADEEEEEEDEEEAEDDESEVEETGEEDSDEESEEEEVQVKPKLNGTATKKEKLKQEPKKVPKESQKLKQKQESKKTPAEGQEKTPNKKADAEGKQKQKQQQMKSPQKKTVANGVIIEDLRQGEGPLAKSGKLVQVFYEGRFKNNNKMFDSSTKTGFNFRLGRGEVIKGWDIGVVGMKVGGKRRIVCPPSAAYGANGSPPTIPPNSTLVFEVELLKVK